MRFFEGLKVGGGLRNKFVYSKYDLIPSHGFASYNSYTVEHSLLVLNFNIKCIKVEYDNNDN